ncbi:hypothetical protein E4T47_00747 [Aureobasidium subglaciale]|nr:hypothetical protein E4T47_00747 [Aureobasidium subglaciale]
MNGALKLSPQPANRLTAREDDRLNEAAKIRIAKLLGIERNMIDLTDDEPPRKKARREDDSRIKTEDDGVKSSAAKYPELQDARPQAASRAQNISPPRSTPLNPTSFPSLVGTSSKPQTMAGANRSMGPPGAYQNHLQMNVHQNQPQTQTHPLHHPTETQNPSLVNYQAPNQTNIPQPPFKPQQPQRPASFAPSQYMELAHPADLLSNISLSVASLETFQLQEILSIAALRHPDILDLLRTCFNQRRRTKILLIKHFTISQEQARIIRTENERVRNNSRHAVGPFGPPHGAAPHPTAPAQEHVPQYGLATPQSQTASRSVVQRPVFRTPPARQEHMSAPDAHNQKSCAQASTNLPAEVTSIHKEINHLLNPKEPRLTPKAKFDTPRFLCYLAIKTVIKANMTVKQHLQVDKSFTNACWQVYNTFDQDSKLKIMQPQALWNGLDTLEKLRDDCYDGYEQFLSTFRENSIYEPEVRVCGSDDEGARRKIVAEEPSMVRDSDEDDVDSPPGLSDPLADIEEYDDNDDEDEGESDQGRKPKCYVRLCMLRSKTYSLLLSTSSRYNADAVRNDFRIGDPLTRVASCWILHGHLSGLTKVCTFSQLQTRHVSMQGGDPHVQYRRS